MPRLFVRRPSPALIISLIALFISLGGTGYALSSASHRPTAISGSSIPKKAFSVRGVSFYWVIGSSVPLPGGGIGNSALATCHAGDRVIGGGYLVPGAYKQGVDVGGEGPQNTSSGWQWAVSATNYSSAAAKLQAYASCVHRR